MDCTEFLDRYSEYHDDEGALADRARFDRHLGACASCRRYRDVMLRATAVLRDGSPPASFREDFRERLKVRLYQNDFETEATRRATRVSPLVLGVAAVGVVAILIMWDSAIEAIFPPPVHALPAITVAPAGGVDVGMPFAAPRGTRVPAALVQPDYWGQSHLLLYEHSSLYQNRQGGLVRTGIQ